MKTSNDTGTRDEGDGPQSSVSSTTRHETPVAPEGSEVRKEKREEKEETEETEELNKKSSFETATETPEEIEVRKEEKREEETKGEEKREKERKHKKKKEQTAATEPAAITNNLNAVEVGGPSRRRSKSSSLDAFHRKCSGANWTSVQSDAPTRRERGRGIDIHRKSRSEGFSSATTSSSSVQPVAQPRRPADSHEWELLAAYSQPGAFRVSGTLESTPSETSDASPLPPDPVPVTHQSQKDTQGGFLVEANIVTEPDLSDIVFAELEEQPHPVDKEGLGDQHKIPRRAFILFLLAIGLAVGVGVGVGLQRDGSTSGSPLFDCSNAAVGCLYTGTESLYFQDPGSFLVATCTDTDLDFDIPTSDDCVCEVNVPTYAPGSVEGFDSCQSCSFVDSADGGWQIDYDCSNLLLGDCISRDTSNNCISQKRFESTAELRSALDRYLADNGRTTLVARTYGWPIGLWDVSMIQDFSYIFAASSTVGIRFSSNLGARFNPLAVNFNEDISDWNVSGATTMEGMFYAASSFNQPIGAWDVSSVRSMAFMMTNATSFNQPLVDWNMSSVTDMTEMFHLASSFDQPIGAWDVSSVQVMGAMFREAGSFDQPLVDWDVSRVNTMYAMFFLASSFNQTIGAWDVSNVTDIQYMFQNATAFQQNLCPWARKLPEAVNVLGMFVETSCPNPYGPNPYGTCAAVLENFCFDCQSGNTTAEVQEASCLDSLPNDLDGWTMVAHMSGVDGKAFLGNTNLESSKSYNCPTNLDPSSVTPTTADFQCSFDDITNIRNEVLFVTGDQSIWAKASYEDIARGGVDPLVANTEFQRCVCGKESSITGSILNRPGQLVDPLIAIADGDNYDGSRAGLMIWGENGNTDHAFLRLYHGGVNVYIRPLV
jgi:hypothetical protein